MNWLTRALARADLTTNPQGLDDGGLGVGGKLFDGQSQLFFSGRKDVYKKKRRNPRERPGEQDSEELHTVR